MLCLCEIYEFNDVLQVVKVEDSLLSGMGFVNIIMIIMTSRDFRINRDLRIVRDLRLRDFRFQNKLLFVSNVVFFLFMSQIVLLVILGIFGSEILMFFYGMFFYMMLGMLF